MSKDGRVSSSKSKGHNGTTERIIEALKEYGPMTVRELARLLNVPRDNISSLVNWLRVPTPQYPVKRVYMCEWTYDDEECANPYPRPVYKLGSKPDAPKPAPLTRKEKAKQQRDRMRNRNRCTSVFNLAAGYKKASLKHVGSNEPA